MRIKTFILFSICILLIFSCSKKPIDTPVATIEESLKIFTQKNDWNFIRIDELNVPIQRSNAVYSNYTWTNNKTPDTLFFYDNTTNQKYVQSYIFRDTSYEKFIILNKDTISSILIINNNTRNTIDTEYISLTSQAFTFSPSQYGHYGLISFTYKLPLQLNNVPSNQCPSCPGIMSSSTFYQKTDTSYSFSNTIFLADIYIGSSFSSYSGNHMSGGGYSNSIFISKQNGLLKSETGTFDYMTNYGTQSMTTTRFRLN